MALFLEGKRVGDDAVEVSKSRTGSFGGFNTHAEWEFELCSGWILIPRYCGEYLGCWIGH